jgi:hypothetical protein
MNDGNGEFSKKLENLRHSRNTYINKTIQNLHGKKQEGIKLIKDIADAQVSLQSNEKSKTKFIVYWMSSPTKGKLCQKGPYVQFKYKVTKTRKWESIHLGSLASITKKKIKAKLGVSFYDVDRDNIDNVIHVKHLFDQLAELIKLFARVLKQYHIKMINHEGASWDSLSLRLEEAAFIIEDAITADISSMKTLEYRLDKAMLAFNQAMRRRYRSFFVKWDINPTAKKSCMGQGLAQMHIVTKLLPGQRYTKTVKQFKKSLVEKEGMKSRKMDFSPWVTNRLLRVGRASVLRKRLMAIQTDIKTPLAIWEKKYNRLLEATTNLNQLNSKR